MYVFITLGLILAILCIAFGIWLVVSFNRALQLRKITEQTKEDILSSYHHLIDLSNSIKQGSAYEAIQPIVQQIGKNTSSSNKPETVLGLQGTRETILSSSQTNKEMIVNKENTTGLTPKQYKIAQQLIFDIASKKRYLNAHAKAYNAHVYTFPTNIIRMIASRKPIPLWPTLPNEESGLPTDILYLDI